MKKQKALEKAANLGYSIKYHETESELRFRKPGSAVTPLNQPYEYCSVFKEGRGWEFEERVEPHIL